MRYLQAYEMFKSESDDVDDVDDVKSLQILIDLLQETFDKYNYYEVGQEGIFPPNKKDYTYSMRNVTITKGSYTSGYIPHDVNYIGIAFLIFVPDSIDHIRREIFDAIIDAKSFLDRKINTKVSTHLGGDYVKIYF